MKRFFVYFLLSGCASLLYETVWLRLAMAQFGVTAALTSIVLSVFMLGLAIGSGLAGRISRRLKSQSAARTIRFYALTELLIGLLGLGVPALLRLGGHWVHGTVTGAHPLAYAVATGTWVLLSFLPSGLLMGATLPLGMLALRKSGESASNSTFSHLYLANVTGAILGTASGAFALIELLGFRQTLWVAAVLNLLIAALAWVHPLSELSMAEGTTAPTEPLASPTSTVPGARTPFLGLLFLTGLGSMAMEVVWIREFTPLLGTVVYAFAAILCIYLLATIVGSWVYRRSTRVRRLYEHPATWAIVALLSLLPLLLSDFRLGAPGIFNLARGDFESSGLLRALLGIAPFSLALGFLTPQLVDEYAQGESDRAGPAYAVNTVGCILGPLIAGFVLLPTLGDRFALICLASLFGLYALTSLARRFDARGLLSTALPLTLAVALALWARSFDQGYPQERVYRDDTATTVASERGGQKVLFVNGVAMTTLTPITKMMAHLPSALLSRRPESALVICFGMGTTFRSMLSWSMDTTVVELVPGVPKLFRFFHSDADAVLANPRGHVVVDDGRRFLETVERRYDLIMIDPPPPVQAASTSLLYSVEFYEAARSHLSEDGILAQWNPGHTDMVVLSSMIGAVQTVFPHVRIFRSFKGNGFHVLASMTPIPMQTAAELARKLPATAAQDLLEWGPHDTVQEQYAEVLSREVSLEKLMARLPTSPPLQDDFPINEYYLLRRLMR